MGSSFSDDSKNKVLSADAQETRQADRGRLVALRLGIRACAQRLQALAQTLKAQSDCPEQAQSLFRESETLLTLVSGEPFEQNLSDGARAAEDTVPIAYERVLREFGDADLVGHLLTQFFDNVQGQLVRMAEALEGRDFETIRREAHSIKGGAGTLEAWPFFQATRATEVWAKEASVEKLSPALDCMRAEYERLKLYVERLG